MVDERPDRGISEVVGFILVLGILIGLLSLYQVYAVTTQNRKVEFKHNLRVEEDLLSARNAILETKRTGQGVSVAVELGTVYPTRLFSINPPPAAGELRTTENGTIEVLNAAGNEVQVCPVTNRTRMLEYEPQYNVYEGAPIHRYENTVVYAEYADGVRLRSGQKLVEGRTVNLIPVITAFREFGTRTIAFEPRAGQLDDTRVVDPTVMVPTELSNETWVDLLAGEVEPGRVDVMNGTLRLSLDGTYTISCGPVALNRVPPGGERVVTGSEINPAGPGTVELRSSFIEKNDDTLVYTAFNNTASEPINVTSARIAFVFDAQTSADKTIDYAEVYDTTVSASNLVANLSVLGPTEEFTTPITLPATTDHQIAFDFNVGIEERDFFVVKFVFETGESGTYFVGLEGTGTQATPTPTATPTPAPTNQPPVADFTYSRTKQNKVDLDGTPSFDSDGTVATYEWDVGNDGSVDYTGQTVNDAIVHTGTVVELTVTDDDGATNSTTKTIP